jgi:hypothetical protein
MLVDGIEILPRDYRALKMYYEIVLEQNEKLKEQNNILFNFIMNLTDDIAKEFDKDGWCRLVIKKEKIEEYREFLKGLK